MNRFGLRYLLIIATTLLCWPGFAAAAPAETQQQAAKPASIDASLLSLSYLSIAVASIDSVTLQQLNKEMPPLPVAQLRITEQLRGQTPAAVGFVPLLYGTKAYDEQAAAQAMIWKGQPLDRIAGKQWIIFSNGANVIELYPYSEQNVAYIRAHMAAPGLSDSIRIALVVLILALMLLPMAWMIRIGHIMPALLLLLQCAAYGIYESGTPAYENIRADLLALIPALLFNAYRTLRYYQRMRLRR
jgi:hypothetical protein